MSKMLILISLLGLSLANAQTVQPGIPPVHKADVTATNKGALSVAVHAFVKTASKEIQRCSNGSAQKMTEFLEIHNYLSLKVNELKESPICDDNFLKCVVTDEFAEGITHIVEHEKFMIYMTSQDKVTRKSARQVRTFYRDLLKGIKEK